MKIPEHVAGGEGANQDVLGVESGWVTTEGRVGTAEDAVVFFWAGDAVVSGVCGVAGGAGSLVAGPFEGAEVVVLFHWGWFLMLL